MYTKYNILSLLRITQVISSSIFFFFGQLKKVQFIQFPKDQTFQTSFQKGSEWRKNRQTQGI